MVVDAVAFVVVGSDGFAAVVVAVVVSGNGCYCSCCWC